MDNYVIEFENQIKSSVDKSQTSRGTDLYRVTQPALLFIPGEKHPDKFDFDLYFGTDPHKADAVQPLPVGRYRFKNGAIGTVNNYGRTSLNLDGSLIEPLQNQSSKVA